MVLIGRDFALHSLTTLEVAVFFFFFAIEEEISQPFDSSPQVFAINDLGRGPAGVKTFTLREG